MKKENLQKLGEIIDNLWDEFEYYSSNHVKILIRELITDLTGIKSNEENINNDQKN